MLSEKNSAKIPVIVIFAPTASGKTALTRDLFSPLGSHFILNAEIISADSQAVYKGMDIGTAKPEASLLKEIPHHLIDLVTPDCQFNVSDFVDMADKACLDIYGRGKMPVVCGGTGFYIRNFLSGVPKTPQSDENLRNKLKERIKTEGNLALYKELQSIDPESAEKIHPNDEYRICRALEVYYLSGQKRSSFAVKPELRDKYRFLFLILEPEREVLYERIRQRVDLMFDVGLKQEVQRLTALGYTKEMPGMKAIGYSEWFEYDNEDEIRQQIKHHSCKYAKKQFTYVRDIGQGIRIPYENNEKSLLQILDLIKDFCNNRETL